MQAQQCNSDNYSMVTVKECKNSSVIKCGSQHRQNLQQTAPKTVSTNDDDMMMMMVMMCYTKINNCKHMATIVALPLNGEVVRLAFSLFPCLTNNATGY